MFVFSEQLKMESMAHMKGLITEGMMFDFAIEAIVQ
jgi:hypothetical protein